MQQFFESGEMPWSYDYILKKTQIYLAAFYSHMEKGGRMVSLDELPEDWSAPIIPASFETVEGSWGRISQTAQVEGQSVRWQRNIEVKTDTLAPDDFKQLRVVINNLRAANSRVLAFTKKDQ